MRCAGDRGGGCSGGTFAGVSRAGPGWLGELTGKVFALGDTNLASPDDSAETLPWGDPFVIGVVVGEGDSEDDGLFCADNNGLSDAGAPG